MEYRHTPVMLDEALAWLNPRPGKNYIDCTLGGGGYSLAIADRISSGKLLAIDLDPLAIDNARELISEKKLRNIILANDNFSRLKKIVEEKFPRQKDIKFAGIVFDLGLSAAQLSDRRRGFSFQADTPLVMSFGVSGEEIETHQIINSWPREALEKVLREFGEEPFARPIAKAIVSARRQKPILTTGELVSLIEATLPGGYLGRLRRRGIHPATKTFQALRIATNRELENLTRALEQCPEILEAGGRIVVVSYHSLEDRIVKRFFKEASRPEAPEGKAGLKILTKHVIRPRDAEVRANPRSRSAKLRAAEVIG